MSSLFGTLSESDLEDINRNVRMLAKNQKQIIHDLDVSLSVLNLTRSQVAENRRSIMDLIEVIQKLDVKILKMQEMFSQRFVRLEQFVHTYLQLQMIFDEIKQTTQDAIFYLDSLRSLPTPGRFFFQKIDFFHFLIFCSTSYYKQNNAK